MTFEVQQTRWDRIIRRVSGSIGPGSRVSETLSELFPVIDVERVPAELLALGGTRLASGRTSQSATASNFQMAMLRNPGGSGALLRLVAVIVSSQSAQAFGMGITTNTFANLNAANTAFLDGRLFASTVPVGEVRNGISLSTGVRFLEIRGGVFESVVWQPPEAVAVLSPGTAFSITTTTINTQLATTFMWLERPAEQSELSL